jgi:hypothetical protein
MIGVVGKQNSVEIPSRFRISAMTFMTCIDLSSRWVDRRAGLYRTGQKLGSLNRRENARSTRRINGSLRLPPLRRDRSRGGDR